LTATFARTLISTAYSRAGGAPFFIKTVSDRRITTASPFIFAFLLAISLMPFSTKLLAGFITYRLALVVYWLNIVLAGVTLYWSWRYAVRGSLVKSDMPPEFRVSIERRIIGAQSLYAFGALLCIISTYVSIAFIVAVQLNYAIAPRFRPLLRT
jgi:uncharacterized membrane protein